MPHHGFYYSNTASFVLLEAIQLWYNNVVASKFCCAYSQGLQAHCYNYMLMLITVVLLVLATHTHMAYIQAVDILLAPVTEIFLMFYRHKNLDYFREKTKKKTWLCQESNPCTLQGCDSTAPALPNVLPDPATLTLIILRI